MKHRMTYEFEVVVEEDDEDIERRRYTACCSELTGCRVHADTEDEALEKIRTAIGMWIHFADRNMDQFNVEDYM